MTAARPLHPVTLVVRKSGELAWLGHLDLARALERALRRAELPLRFTEGFHKRIRMRLPEPLPLGVGSEAERYVVHFGEPVAAAEVMTRLDGRLPAGVAVVAAWDGSHPEAKDVALELELDAERADELTAAIAALPSPPPDFTGRVEWVGAVRLADDGGGSARVVLHAPPGGRVSVGRFLELFRALRPGGLALRTVTRCVAWQSAPPSLPSPAPFAPENPGEQGESGENPLATPSARPAPPSNEDA